MPSQVEPMNGVKFSLAAVSQRNGSTAAGYQHLRIIPDYCSWAGLLVLASNQNTPNSDTNPLGGQPMAGLWLGKTDDLWHFGGPQGWGAAARDSGRCGETV